MRYFAIVFLVTGVACHSKEAARGAPVDAAPPPVASVAIGPPRAPPVPPTPGIVQCTSSDGTYRVELKLQGSDPQPRTARVFIDGHDLSVGTLTGAPLDRGFPPPGALTCSKNGAPSNSICSVAHTADYGYLVDSILDKQGKRTVELSKNGVATEHLAMLDCDS